MPTRPAREPLPGACLGNMKRGTRSNPFLRSFLSMRRSMNQALQKFELPPEAVALIREGRPAPQAVAPVISVEPASLPAHEPERKRARKVEGERVEALSPMKANPDAEV